MNMIRRLFCKVNISRPYFGINNKSLVYNSNKISIHLRNIIVGISFISFMNLTLFISENINPLFGNVSYYSFLFCSCSGICFISIISLYCSRTVKSMYLYKCGTKIELEFYLTNKILKLNIKEIGEKKISKFGFIKFDIVQKGFYWIQKEENDFYENLIYKNYVNDIIDGKELLMNKYNKKIKKYN